MTYKKALEQTEKSIEMCEGANVFSINLDYWRKVKEALENQIPKKFEIIKGQDCCPTCKKIFGSDVVRKRLLRWEMDYCKYCGQKLDWSEENE